LSAFRRRGFMRRILIFIMAAMILLSLASCSKSIIEQQRPAVMEYVAAFTKIDNDLSQTSSKIFDPSAASDLIQFNNALNQGVTAMNGVIQSLDAVKPPDIPEVKTHLDNYRQLIQDSITILQTFKTALLAGDQTGITQAENDLAAIAQRDSSLNRSTEALMLKYNISDAQVNYKSRGK
jgi:hypothetical protein